MGLTKDKGDYSQWLSVVMIGFQSHSYVLYLLETIKNYINTI